MDRLDDSLPLKPVEFHILLGLAAAERHGYAMIKDIEAHGASFGPDVRTIYWVFARMVYRALPRMSENGLIAEVGEPDASRPASRRRKYRITERGLRVLRAEARRLDALVGAARVVGILDFKLP